ncbi:hypothetical protein A2865_03340 [Candidatus Woesebacteria bacterium RIFCSPHIGHO2_01_FULL_39_17]|uniref:Mannosyltransferase n=3 Tax=Candidatus Woeseibacteriota TaxID=1752722 RepID=A0A0G0RFI9_9BACT|nr:MAG: hypothetical protein US72_C0010G0042 [Microgenomates group bacterium GW2011_GWC1_38_12]KKQ94062.1 MAG: hypothetical protein UT19_C0004G0023 [Candidatus Woesebacteria bacterium GW2011_GWB1_39_10b]KKR12447.1 MAG: hypothetical protein UT40_C0026G0008 [Candidatus Woesebacteria bacterium GW2011_GWA1_39_21b]OGM24363.1 MAG: hypothetical protein A2865_03340 [Candidatus Woesebacteria bacterium RIFCSPHIGHO2_01_FULL_39_17]OGM61097.1 MAG: hypothetical protein A3A52_04880 [Candidatus Woesebacteria b
MLTSLTNKWWFWWLVVGIVLRLILIPITFHPDLWGHSSVAYFFAYEGRLNIYDHLASLSTTHPLVRSMGVGDIFIYPPLTYFTLGIFRFLVRPFADPNFMPMIWSEVPKALSFPTLHWHLFLFKFPYLFIDIAIAFIFAKFFGQEKRKLAFALWIINPLTLYATFMLGQIDILPTFFVILSLYFLKQKKYRASLISLGIGGAYKSFPLLFILPAAFILGRTFKEKIKYILWGLIPYFLTVAPYLASSTFRQMVLFSPKSTKMLFMGWNVSGAEVIFPFIILLSFLYLHSYYAQNKLSVFSYEFLIMLLTLSITHYHPQWFLWLTPFLLIYLIKSNFKYSLLIISMFLTWLIITLFFEASLSYGLFSPIFPSLSQATSLSDVVNNYTNVFQIKSVVRSFFAGGSIYLSYLFFRNNSIDKDI